jgi:phage terminase small subunit
VKKPRHHRDGPPADLSPEARRLYDRVVAEYAVHDGAGQTLIIEACRALDRLNQARSILAADGLLQLDRFGVRKQHPVAAIERDSAQRMVAALRALRLEPASVIEDRDG